MRGGAVLSSVSPPIDLASGASAAEVLAHQDQENRRLRFCKPCRVFEVFASSSPAVTWVLKWPRSSAMWKLEPIASFLRTWSHEVCQHCACVCQGNVSSPSGAGRRLVTNDEQFARSLPWRCSRCREHARSVSFNPLQSDCFLRAMLAYFPAPTQPAPVPACCSVRSAPTVWDKTQRNPGGDPLPLPAPPAAAAVGGAAGAAPALVWSLGQARGLAPPPGLPRCFPAHAPMQSSLCALHSTSFAKVWNLAASHSSTGYAASPGSTVLAGCEWRHT